MTQGCELNKIAVAPPFAFIIAVKYTFLYTRVRIAKITSDYKLYNIRCLPPPMQVGLYDIKGDGDGRRPYHMVLINNNHVVRRSQQRRVVVKFLDSILLASKAPGTCRNEWLLS